MTAQQYPINKKSSAKPGKPSLRSASLAKLGLGKGQPLNQRLLQTLLPVALLPLAVASGLGIAVTRRSEQNQALFLLTEESFLASEAASVFVEDNFKIIESVLVNPSIQATLRQIDQQVETKGIAKKPIEALEQEFGQNKLIARNSVLNKYLSDVVKIEGMTQLSVTESHGFNVAFSKPPEDFVQRDEEWWTEAKANTKFVEPIKVDESTGVASIAIAEAISPVDSSEFLGVMEAIIPTTVMSQRIATYTATALSGTQQVQIVDTRNGVAFSSITVDGIQDGLVEVLGGNAIVQTSQALIAELANTGADTDMKGLKQSFDDQIQGKLLSLERFEVEAGKPFLEAVVTYQDREYSLTTVPGTAWVAIASVNLAEINSAGSKLLIVFAGTALILGLGIAAILRLLAGQLAAPLQTLTETAQTATSGNLETRAALEGTRETQILGQSFNTLLEQIQELLNSQKALTEEQRKERETLENEITELMEEVGDAADGDLSVRAKLVPGDVGIVADLFNAVIENLRDIAVTVKQSSGDVSQSLLDNEQQIRTLADQAIAEVQSLREAMDAVQEMDSSIQTVADNATQASTLTNDTYATAQAGTQSMEETAHSILELRSTVGETAKKIKRLGESAQKIAQSVSLIDEIALKTNLLAVNASVEASRAGELGQGFTAVAEQVGSLAEQSAGATKTIAQIVAEIQTETQEVVAAIETGTAQVVDSSQQVEATQKQLEEVLAKSDKINQLMQEISASTTNQTLVSKAVTELMQKATKTSEKQSQSSNQVAQAIQETAQVAQKLQASVEQFKVEK
ncbi:methyl-accepting chemotaxis protein [Leptothoe kymatousa]|uniref:HAMP domain-containing protein n=1 Tax=Leptothoe kymatousa TAU-MAC 1615 TaxID=2364775 RepID=A0ABS5Y2J5_9CYAN|nr:methyl-accepting chemotaxis protein [Leptothoe kymatousa]MBT9312027.1 HAMP domain-containing protein [Leptothoe kymatousa TAU-MAC 1615]